ncbi:MAG: 4Fe-4S dicluster domain-containing protein [Planctomycetes bacterium]|nr:4Fe-4S dicluster domain-containing protein [Planctomycetota bacterium]
MDDKKLPVPQPPPSPERRRFLKRAAQVGLAAGVSGIAMAALWNALSHPVIPRGYVTTDPGILRPPGALAEDEFLAACIRCDRCRDACDTKAIRIFGPDEGRLAGTPHIVAQEHACNLCLLCTQACPTGALAETREVTQVRMGTAVVDRRLCVSWNGSGACGACHTICPLKNKAIRQGLYNRPEVFAEHCVGCGLCEEACIVKDRKAIRVFSERAWS